MIKKKNILYRVSTTSIVSIGMDGLNDQERRKEKNELCGCVDRGFKMRIGKSILNTFQSFGDFE